MNRIDDPIAALGALDPIDAPALVAETDRRALGLASDGRSRGPGGVARGPPRERRMLQSGIPTGRYDARGGAQWRMPGHGSRTR